MRLSNNVGNTPLVPIKLGELTVWGKCEFMNPGGSVKDRMATYILNNAEDRGLIKPGATLIEATSGNTGISFAMLAAERGYQMKIVMPCNMSEERKQMLKYYGAHLIEVDEGDFDEAIAVRDELAETEGYFNCNQFHIHSKIYWVKYLGNNSIFLIHQENLHICKKLMVHVLQYQG